MTPAAQQALKAVYHGRQAEAAYAAMQELVAAGYAYKAVSYALTPKGARAARRLAGDTFLGRARRFLTGDATGGR